MTERQFRNVVSKPRNTIANYLAIACSADERIKWPDECFPTVEQAKKLASILGIRGHWEYVG